MSYSRLKKFDVTSRDDIPLLRGVKVLSMNVRGLKKRIGTIRRYYKSADYYCITESLLSNTTAPGLLKLPGYTLYRYDRPSNAGGVCCYVDNKYVPYTNTLHDLCISNQYIESLVLVTDMPNRRKRAVITVYRPPKKNLANIHECYNQLEVILSDPRLSNIELIITGDFNVDFQHRNSSRYRIVSKFLHKTNLKHLPTGPTRNHEKGSTTIDHIYTNATNIDCYGALVEDISDHKPVFMCIKKSVNKIPRKRVTGRSYKRYSAKDMNNHVMNNLQQLGYDVLLNNDVKQDNIECNIDPCTLYNNLINSMYSYLDEHCKVMPLRVHCRKIDQLDDKTNNMVKLKKQYDKRLCDMNMNEVLRAALLRESRRLNKRITFRVNKNISKLTKTRLKRNRRHPKQHWEDINDLWNPKCDRQEIRLVENNITIPTADTAKELNTSFVNCGKILADQYMGLPGNYSMEDALNMPLAADVIDDYTLDHFDYTTNLEVKKLVGDVECYKSSGMNQCRTSVLKDLFLAFSLYLVNIVNLCFDACKFPDQLKIGTIIPLPKKGDLSQITNWRPITLLPTFSKIIEKIINIQLLEYLTSTHKIIDNQFGFLPGKSTDLAIFSVVEELYRNRNDKLHTIAAMIDIRKAFDCLHHGRLIYKLKTMGIRDKCLKLLISYLTLRQSCTLANNIKSSLLSIIFGTAQGSVLGPLLFILYIDDLKNVIKHCVIYLYADDVILISKNADPKIAVRELQEDLNRLYIWCCQNRLTPHAAKTQVIWFSLFSKLKELETLDVYLNNIKLKYTRCVKYLGVWLDSDLTFRKNITETTNSGNFRVRKLASMRSNIDTTTAFTIYKQAILPVLEYCSFLCYSAPSKQVKRLQITQNNGLRYCLYKKKREITNNKLHIRARLQRLDTRRDFKILCIMYRYLQNPKNIAKITHGYNTRYSKKKNPNTSGPSREKYRSSPLYNAKLLWDELPESIQKASCIEIFKREICKLDKFKKNWNISRKKTQ